MKPKRWTILPRMEEETLALQHQLQVHKELCRILVQRGVATYEAARNYFRPSLAELHDPYLMKGMDLAVNRVLQAVHENEKIVVFGDYDVDGTTAVSCMYSFLTTIYNEDDVDFYIPNRYREGYGLSKRGIDLAVENGVTLMITLDCGIKSVELVEYANTLGLDIIICDHHLPGEQIPRAVAVLNPKQTDCPYPYKELCGCGVGFKLISALCIKTGLPESEAHQYLDLVATAIAADIVPMTGENRILAFYGLQKINQTPCTGINALIKLSGTVPPLLSLIHI